MANRTINCLFLSTNLEEEGKFLVAPANDPIKANFNSNHIEGVLIGIRMEPNYMETLEVPSVTVK